MMFSALQARRRFPGSMAVVLCAAAVLTIGLIAVAADDQDRNQQWAASWATAPAAYFVYVAPAPQNQALAPAPARLAAATVQPDLAFPFPEANTRGATTQTIRSIVKPDLWGNRIRVRFSNVFGDKPLMLDAVTAGLQEYGGNALKGTITRVTFGGAHSVAIAAGQERWSDSITLSWVKDADDPVVQGRNLAISYSIQGDSGHMTYHAGANTTSFITWTVRRPGPFGPGGAAAVRTLRSGDAARSPVTRISGEMSAARGAPPSRLHPNRSSTPRGLRPLRCVCQTDAERAPRTHRYAEHPARRLLHRTECLVVTGRS